VVTGGSSAVEPVKHAIRESVVKALKGRKFPPALCDKTELLQVAAGPLGGHRYRQAQVAQLAVALGASSPRLSELKYYPDGLLSGPDMVKRIIERAGGSRQR
jgi:hypothetical protein